MHTDISHNSSKRNVKPHTKTFLKSQTKNFVKPQSKTASGNSKRLKCEKCDFSTFKSRAMKWHFNREHQLRCDKCGKIFKTKEKLSEHSAEPHNTDEGSVTEAAIEYDRATKMFSCSVCNHESDRRNNIFRHIERIHKPTVIINLQSTLHAGCVTYSNYLNTEQPKSKHSTF